MNNVKHQLIEILKKTPKVEYTAEKLYILTKHSVRKIKYNLNQVVKMDIGVSESYKTNGNYCYSLGYYYDKTLIKDIK